ncbi:MAG: AAA family ATPase [Parachlamydiales bacterium]
MPRLCLKRIELVGFKSFADRTSLNFVEGVTGIVGPNGCGKSNIADAFRWVLGEQSAKSLRGDKMADVLFAGTDKRRPAPYCEVTLTFDNSDGHLAIPYEEVAISRRLTRKGDSDYQINGTSCRLKDIHHLFFDTGLGKEAFAIFEQGKIEEIILRNPEERRPIFEQAAGIARYRHQWREAQRRLDQTEQHLTRAHDINGEVEKQIRLLEKQVAEATAYRENKARLELLERGLLQAKWSGHRAQVAAKEGELALLHQKQAASQVTSQELAEQKGRAKWALEQEEGRLKGATEALYALRSRLQVQLAEGEGIRQRLAEVQERSVQCERELAAIQGQEGQIAREAEGIAARRAKLKGALEEAQQALEESQGSLTECQKALHQCQEEQVRLQKGQMDEVQRAHALASRLREGEVRLENGVERLHALKVRQEELDGARGDLKQRLAERTAQSAELTRTVKGEREEVEGLLAELETVEGRLQEIGCEREHLTDELAQNRARHKVLHQLEQEGEGLPKGSRLLLQAFEALIPLADACTPLPGYEQTVATALQLYTGTLLAKDERTLAAALDWAQREGIEGYSLTSPERLAAAATPIAPSVAPHVQPESPLHPLLESLTLTDGLLDHAGILFSPLADDESPVMRRAELKKLTTLIAKGEKMLATLTEEGERRKGERAQLQAKRASAEQSLRQTEMKLVECNVSLDRTRTDAAAIEKEERELLHRQEEIAALQRKLSVEIDSLQKEVDKARIRLTTCQEEADRIAKKLEGYLDQVREFAKGRRQREQRVHELSLERHGLDSTASLIEAKQLGQRKEQTRLVAELEALSKKEKELSAALATLKEPKAEAAALSQAEAEVKALEEALAKIRAELEMIEQKEGEGRKGSDQLQKAAHQLEVDIARERAAAEALAEEMLERFETPIDGEETPLDLPLTEAEKEIRTLRKAVEGATEVNLAAAAEYDEKKTRHHFLSEQLTDLENSKKELEEIIAELDRESRHRFEQTFEEVRRHFQEQFQILFNGGEADLTFVGSDDILQAGIDIVAKPPGKKMRSIKLLSGGEKCLTAMALLFALFKVRPAPFCILDEMDAPLDDSNIARFLSVVRPFMEQTQFLIITHNKRTMAAADTLFGVSMEEKGVSKILSLQFEHRTAVAI